MDRTCVDQQQLHLHQEFYGGLNDTAVEPRLLQCVDVDYIKIVPSIVEVLGVILAECAQSHCLDIDILLCKQFQLSIITRCGGIFEHKYHVAVANIHSTIRQNYIHTLDTYN